MPLNFPSSPTASQTYTDPNSRVWEFDGVKWNIVSGTADKMYSGAKIDLLSSYNLVSSLEPIEFNNEIIDTDSYFSFSTPTKINIIKSGFYRINFSVFTGNAGASYTIQLKQNGSSILSSVIIAPNQFANYDEILELESGNYLEMYVSESTSVGTLLDTTFFEITRLGSLIGTNISAAEAFSGVKGILTSPYNTTSTANSIYWDSTEFNLNANPAGNTYWTNTDSSKFTIGLNAYYRIKGVVDVGTSDNYTVVLKKNNSSELTSITIEPNGYAQIDEIYRFDEGDYLQLIVNDENSTGSLTTNTYFEIIRVGV